MIPPRPRRHTVVGIVLLALLASVVASAAVVPALAAPPPRPLCDGCGDSFAEAAAERGVDVTVQHSTATVRVHENGSATWVVRNRLADDAGADRLRSDAGLRTAVADRAMWNTDLLSTAATDDGVVARYRDDDFAERTPGGALRSDAFTESYSLRNLAGLGADELTVVAPDGMHVAATVSGSTRSDDGTRTTLTEFTEDQEGEFVTFVPGDSPAGPLLSLVAVGSAVWLVAAANAVVFLALPTAAFGLLVGALLGGLSWARARSTRPLSRLGERAGAVLTVAGLFVTFGSLFAGVASLFGGSAAPAVGAGVTTTLVGVALSRPAVRDRLSYRTLVVVAAVAVLLAAAVTVAAAVVLRQNGVTRSLLSSLWFFVALFALLPAGYAAGRGDRRLALATAVSGFLVTILPLVPVTTPALGNGLLVALLTLVGGTAVAVVGSPLLTVGASLAADPSNPSDGAAETTRIVD
ncbi:hypothetical protein SAMN04487948_102449 [Halogranum amylolyticum]|uniref:Uncharacterized protein n=1 Tax=Halogranum amylolyticum TaxID=660520 RepID=A0A1H8PS04_9EURY|nr:hypothetical protein [Halogranum amylolyticum]SEO44541.1 hypothetical protein SAMN04487948_102449 [Halogranum amylolyticum]